MRLYLFILATGWMAALGFVVEILLPYVIRRQIKVKKWPADSRPFLQRMQPHFLLGYAVTGLAFGHATTSMSGGRVPVSGMAGLTAASFCLFLFIVQALVGLTMQNSEASERRALRRFHFWTMVSCIPLLLAHLWLN